MSRGVVPGDGDTVPEEWYAAPAFYPVVHVGRELHAVLASASVGAGPIRAGRTTWHPALTVSVVGGAGGRARR